MSKPRLLDLFCGAGGAGMGYHRAGFEVVGVDVAAQPRYPFEFHQADALTFPLYGFDAIHASPPCQRWTRSTMAEMWPDMIEPTRHRLIASGQPYVIENVPRAPLHSPTVLCGSSFGLRVRRHRAFESNVLILAMPCAHAGQEIVTVTGGGPSPASFRRGPGATGGPDRKPRNLADALDAMGVDWPMTRREVNEAIPPAYTEHIGGYLMRSALQEHQGGMMSDIRRPRPSSEARRKRQLRNLGYTDPDGELTERGERYAEDQLEHDRLDFEDDYREPDPYPDSNLY